MANSTSFSPRAAALIVLVIGGATIAGAWAFELIGRLQPCPLCLEQRWPYYIGLPLALLAMILAEKRGIAALVLALVALVLLYGAGLGIYHAGIEWELWPGPPACAAGGGTIPTDVGDLLAGLQGTQVPSCTEAAWRLGGISLAGWNALVSLVLAVVAAAGARAAFRAR